LGQWPSAPGAAGAEGAAGAMKVEEGQHEGQEQQECHAPFRLKPNLVSCGVVT